MTTTITSKGQVTIPKAVRDHLGVEPGNKIEFEMALDGRIFLQKAGSARPPSRFERLIGCADAGMTTDEIMALTRGED